jgi:hypothetical protein
MNDRSLTVRERDNRVRLSVYCEPLEKDVISGGHYSSEKIITA